MKRLGRNRVFTNNNLNNTVVVIVMTALTGLLGACSSLQGDAEHSNPVARVFDTYLYKEDIKDLIAMGTTVEDSANFVKRYLDTWIKQQLVLNKAKLNLSNEQAFNSIEKQLEDYRTSLIIYAYQRELVKQKLDTVVPETEIKEYYAENVKNLILRNDIIRVRYVKIPKGAPGLEKAREWCFSDGKEDLVELEDYSHKYAKSFLLNDRKWILVDNLELELGTKVADGMETLKPEGMLELQDSINVYLVYVLDLIAKDNPAPVEYVFRRIREILLNRRRSELISNMELSAYQDGVSKNYFEVYE